MKVYTYFQELPGIKPDPKLLFQWAKSWRHYGWEPVVLGLEDAINESKEDVESILASKELGRGKLPSGYCHATHIQWIAMRGVGDGLKVDFDVLNNGFTEEMLLAEMLKHPPRANIFLNACCCNCAVYAGYPDEMAGVILRHAGEASEYERTGTKPPWVDPQHKIEGHAMPHEIKSVCHDQAVFQRFEPDWSYPEKSYVVEYTNNGWQSAPLIHFCNMYVRSPRSRTIQMLGLNQLK